MKTTPIYQRTITMNPNNQGWIAYRENEFFDSLDTAKKLFNEMANEPVNWNSTDCSGQWTATGKLCVGAPIHCVITARELQNG